MLITVLNSVRFDFTDGSDFLWEIVHITLYRVIKNNFWQKLINL